MNNKKSELSVNTIIVAALALIVLVVLFAIFTGKWASLFLNSQLNESNNSPIIASVIVEDNDTLIQVNMSLEEPYFNCNFSTNINTKNLSFKYIEGDFAGNWNFFSVDENTLINISKKSQQTIMCKTDYDEDEPCIDYGNVIDYGGKYMIYCSHRSFIEDMMFSNDSCKGNHLFSTAFNTALCCVQTNTIYCSYIDTKMTSYYAECECK